MKSHTLLSAGAVICGVFLSAVHMSAQAKKSDSPGHRSAVAERMDTVTEMATPGEAHKELAELAGTWDVATTVAMEDGNAPVISKGMATYRVILAGPFLMRQINGDMMGMLMEGIGLTGYDTFKE